MTPIAISDWPARFLKRRKRVECISGLRHQIVCGTNIGGFIEGWGLGDWPRDWFWEWLLVWLQGWFLLLAVVRGRASTTFLRLATSAWSCSTSSERQVALTVEMNGAATSTILLIDWQGYPSWSCPDWKLTSYRHSLANFGGIGREEQSSCFITQ